MDAETRDELIKLKGQFDNIDKKFNDFKDLVAKNEKWNNQTPYEDIKYYPMLKVRLFYGGIPILSTVSNIAISDLSKFNGQLFLINSTNTNGARSTLAFRINNTTTTVDSVSVYSTTTNLKGSQGQLLVINATGNTTPRKVLGIQIGNTVSTVALT